MCLRRILLGAVAAPFLLAAVPALAEDCETSPSGLWERATLPGDFAGARTEWCKKGIQLGALQTADYLNNPTGGLRRGGKYQGRLEMDLDLDFEKLAEMAGLTAHAGAFWVQGGRESGKNIGNLITVDNAEGVPALRLYTLWLQQSLWGDTVNVRLGQLAADDEFAVSKVGTLFVNSTFGWPAAISANLPSGGPAYPLATPGVRLKIAFNDQLSWMTGVFDGDPAGRPNGQDAQYRNHDGTNFSLAEGSFTITELGYAVNQGKDDAGLAGGYKLGAWYNSERFNDQRWDSKGLSLADANSTGTGKPLRGDWGVYGVIDQMLIREQPGADQGLSVFLRAGASPSDRNVVSAYVDGGVAYKGLWAERPDDTVGFAFATAIVSDRLSALDNDTRRINNQPTRPVRDAETVLELSYQAQLAPWWTLQPDLQYVIHPGGNIPNPNSATGLSPIGDALVVGARSTVKF